MRRLPYPFLPALSALSVLLFLLLLLALPLRVLGANLKPCLLSLIQAKQSQLQINAISLAVLSPGMPKPLGVQVGSQIRGMKAGVTENTLYKVGSIAKTYTASLIMAQVVKGKIKLSDPLGRYLPQYIKWKNITIAQLLDQTSGILDYNETPGWWRNLMVDRGRVWHVNELIALAYQAKDPFAPGMGWLYSNTNYLLLGLVLEKVTGKSVQVLMDQLIQSAALEHTYYYPKPYSETILSQMAHGYFRNKYDETKLNGSWLRTAGAILSTPADMTLWMRAIFQGDHSIVGLPLAKHFQFISTQNGKIAPKTAKFAYSLGVFREHSAAGLVYFTPGLTSGYVSLMGYAPKYKTYFAFSGSKAPIPGFRDQMTSGVMACLAMA